MHPLFRRVWISGIVMFSLIDIGATYAGLGRGGLELNYFPRFLIESLGYKITMLVLAPIISILIFGSMILVADRLWKPNGPQKDHYIGYAFFNFVFLFKLVVAAWTTRQLIWGMWRI